MSSAELSQACLRSSQPSPLSHTHVGLGCARRVASRLETAIRQPARAARARTAAAVSGLCGGSAAARRVVQGGGLRARATQRYSPHDTHSSRRAGVRLARWATHALRDVQVLPKDRMSGDSPYVCFLLCTHRLQGFYLFCAITSHPQIFTPQLFTPHDTHFTGPRERPSLRTA